MEGIDNKLADQLAKHYLASLYWFDKDVLGYTDMETDVHLDLCEFIEGRYVDEEGEQPKDFKMCLLPRGSFKSSIVTVGYSVKSIIINPDIRILLANENFSNAKRFASEVRNHFEGNEFLRLVYGDFVGRRDWREDYFTVSRRRANFKEPTLSCAGIDVVKVGMHYDLIIADDLVSQANITTRDQMEKVIDFYRLALSLLEPGGKMIVIGTRWHFNDLYNHIITNEGHRFNKFVRAAYKADGSLWFPSRLSEKFLDEQRKSQGSYHFACQYLNNPIDDDNAVFTKKNIRYYDIAQGLYRPDIDLSGIEEENRPKPYGLADMNLYIHIDPAVSELARGDFSGLVVTAIDPNDFIYVLEAAKKKLKVFDLIDEIFRLFEKYEKYNVQQVLLETQVFQVTLKYFLMDKMSRERKYLPLHEVTHSWQKSKTMRISGLQPRFEFGTIFLGKDMADLEDELLRFPVGQHDDILDALSFGLEVWSKPAEHKSTAIPPYSFMWYRKMANKPKGNTRYIGNEGLEDRRILT